jgi:hypothetical protein
VRETCTPEDGIARCERDYLASSGGVEIEELGLVGEMLTGALVDAVLVETEIDWDSGSFGSSPVEGGASWCIGELGFDVGVSPYPAR